MAQIREVRLVDDLDGSQGTETVNFALDGRSLEIDLNEANAARLRDVLAPYVAAARRAGSATVSQSRSRRGTGAADRKVNAAVREWARNQGMKVSERGRIPSDVIEAYQNRGPSVMTAAAPVFQQPTGDAGAKPKRARRSTPKAHTDREAPSNDLAEKDAAG